MRTRLLLGAVVIPLGVIAASSAEAGGGKISQAEVEAPAAVYRQRLAAHCRGEAPRATDSPGGGSWRALFSPRPRPNTGAEKEEEVPKLTAFSLLSLAALGEVSLWASTDAGGEHEEIAQETNASEEGRATGTSGRQWLEFPPTLALAYDGVTGCSSLNAPPAPADRWRFQLAPYAWLPAMKGSATVRGMKQPVSLSLCDLFRLADEFDVIVPLQFEARHGRWKLWLDVQYMKMHDRLRQSISKQAGPVIVTADATVNVNMRMLLTEFGIDYELLRLPLGQGQAPQLRFDVRAGGRYIYMKGEAGIAIQGAAEIGPGDVRVPIGGLGRDSGGSRDWIEPLVGAGVTLDINEKLKLMARGDIGGFGLGSDLTWQVVGGVEWKLCDWAALFAGYRLLDIAFEEGSGQSKFAFDVQMRGPYLAVMFRF
ncbi:MAG: porin family protein [Planctomycetota bacterium]